jgi:hypothetical protein
MAKGKSGIDGRNMGLDNKVTLGILDVALSTLVRENRYPSKLELADGIRHYYNSKKMSAEYKQIKKLLPLEKKTSSRFGFTTPGFLHTKENGQNPIYALTFRGLLLYLYLCKKYLLKRNGLDERTNQNKPGRIRGYDDRKSSTVGTRKKERTIREIGKIFDKPSILENAPFLKYWREFEKCGFNVIELLLEIAEELYKQLRIDAEMDRYLLRRASERYFVQVENYCHELIDDVFYSEYLVRKGKVTVDQINNLAQTRHMYRKHMIPLQKEWIKRQQQVIDYVDNKRKESDIGSDSSFNEGKPILLKDLATKYGTDVAMVSKALGSYHSYDPDKPHYYPYDEKKYLITNTCLIPVHEIDKLKPVLSNGMNFLNVCSIFEKHGIPESCHQEIIPKLGFEIIRMLGDKWNDTSKWFIVERPLSNIESFCRTYLK